MGRLTLNVLLSFAQFEREVTGERIRDKIAASKKKGAAVPAGQLNDVGGQPLLIVWPRRNAPLGGPMLPKHAADPRSDSLNALPPDREWPPGLLVSMHTG
jgi:hypothetical protein